MPIRGSIFFLTLAMLPMGAFGQTLPATATASVLDLQAIRVREFRFTGNTVFSNAELGAIVAPYLGKELTFEHIDDARRKITDHYISKGYITSGATLPEQSISEGVVWIRVIEGKLEKLSLSGNNGLAPSYFSERLNKSLRGPLQVNAIKEAMELLQQDPRLTSLQGRLVPGSELGLAVFDLKVQEARPYQIGLQFDNAGTPSTGAERLALLASHLNLTGVGDTLSLRFGPIAGGVSNPEWAPTNDIAVQYTRPLIGDATQFMLYYARNDLSLIEPPLSDLGSDTITDSLALALRQSLWRTPREELSLTLALTRRDNHTTLMGQNFSFSDGAIDGWMNSTALRASGEWTTRTETWVLAARSTVSFGLGLSGDTIRYDGEPDARFVTWLGELQHAWRIEPIDSLLLSRATVQLADRHLLAVEQFTLGGVDTVRGYRESTLLSDNAFLLSFELRKPLPAPMPGVNWQAALFADGGYGWDRGRRRDAMGLASVGCGLLFDFFSHVEGQIYWGIPLCNHPQGDNLQDMGIHFQIVIKAF